MLRACTGAAAMGCWEAARRTERASKDIGGDGEDGDENWFSVLAARATTDAYRHIPTHLL